MTEALTLSLAGEPLRIELSDPGLADELREWSRGYLIAPVPPWLTVTLDRLTAVPQRVGATEAHRHGSGGWVIAGPRLRGELRWAEGWHYQGEVYDLISLSQLLYLCLALLWPDRGVLLLHADTVLIEGVAVAFLGVSGAGKSTAATCLVEQAGARRLGVDRTAVRVGSSGPVVIPTPRLVPGLAGESAARLGASPLRGLFFPNSVGPAGLRWMGPLEAHQQVLRSVIMPRGEGLPVARALTLVQGLLERLEAAELGWSLGRELAAVVRNVATSGDEKAVLKRSGSER